MGLGVTLIVVSVLFAALYVAARNAMTVCVAEIVGGALTLRSGFIAPRVLADLRDVVKRPPVGRATLRVIRAGAYARIEVRGTMSEVQIQQIRNVIGTVPLAKLTS